MHTEYHVRVVLDIVRNPGQKDQERFEKANSLSLITKDFNVATAAFLDVGSLAYDYTHRERKE